MDARTWRRAAAAVAFAVALWMALLQGPLTPGVEAPPWLFTGFFVGWIAVGVALLAWPRGGPWVAVLWGALSASGAWRTHATAGWENLALVALSVAAAALAAVAVALALARR